jgi:hypothetical protein
MVRTRIHGAGDESHHQCEWRFLVGRLAKCSRSGVRLALLAVLLLGFQTPTKLMGANGQLELRVIDQETREPIAVRMHLWNAKGRPVLPRGTLAWKDHFVFPGSVVLDLPTGDYRFEIERGPEYALRSGHFRIQRGDQDSKQVDMQRFVDMKSEGWWSGDIHVHRPPEDMRLLMLAEDLHIAPVITWWNDVNAWSEQEIPKSTITELPGSRFYDVMAGEDERGGGALLYFLRSEPLNLVGSQREFPSSVRFLVAAKSDGPVHVDAEKPFWWDFPMWLAARRIDSIGIAHNHMWRDGVLDNEAWGRSRDKLRYPAPHGNGQWTQDIYFHVLNAGLRIPPSAGSASGVLPNPVGYNRVYVHLEGDLTYEKWWEGLRAGRVVVTNGPLLRPRVDGRLPGHVFTAPEGEVLDLSIQLNLSLREEVEYLEVVQNGRVVHEVRLAEYAEARGKLPEVRFEESGWMLVRAVTNHPKTYRFASSGPFYVEIGGRPRISRQSAEFFVDWLQQRESSLEHDRPEELDQLRGLLAGARRFWEARAAAANAD